MRDYGVEQIFGGDKDCEHEWGERLREHHPGQVEQTKWKNAEGAGKGQTRGAGNICLKCHAWRGQLGLEPAPEMYIEHMTEIFNEVKRVLKKEGTLWLNIGDTYSTHTGKRSGQFGKDIKEGFDDIYSKNRILPLQEKCLCMIPERLAWSLIQNGWILRNKIIWYKPNGMPSSVRDRFSNRWEYIYMFSKSQRYFFDLDTVREEHLGTSWATAKRLRGEKESQGAKADYNATTKTNAFLRGDAMHPLGKNPGDVFEIGAETRTMGAIIGQGGGVKVPGGKGWTGHPEGGGAACQKDPRWCPPGGKNPGDFWSINTQPFPEAHFAVFPEKLCEKPIKAGCPEQVCKKCGKAKERIVEIKRGKSKATYGTKHIHVKNPQFSHSGRNYEPIEDIKTIGWTSCDCNAGFEGGIVLDPFCGAGTTLYVAKEMRRRFIGIDVKQEYCDMAEKRLAQGVL